MKTRRSRKLMCQNGYISMETCFQNISQRECYYGNRTTMLLTSWKVETLLTHGLIRNLEKVISIYLLAQ